MDKKQRSVIIIAIILLVIAVICLFVTPSDLTKVTAQADELTAQRTPAA